MDCVKLQRIGLQKVGIQSVGLSQMKGNWVGSSVVQSPQPIAAWSAAGKTNDDEDRAILKDLTGNGHDITLNGFSFNTEGSGYGHPEYPDALVFDGVDDYGVCENMPILTDYTIIANRYIDKQISVDAAFLSKSASSGMGAFIFENTRPESTIVYSFGNHSYIEPVESKISWQTTTSYNNQIISKGSAKDSNSIFIGTFRLNDSRFWKGAFYCAYLFDRSLTEEEIKAFIRKNIDPEYVLPSEQQTTE